MANRSDTDAQLYIDCMNKGARKHTEWGKPLTKADFYLYQLEKHLGLYAAAGGVLFVVGIVLAAQAIYEFLSGAKYYGLDRLVYSVLCLVIGRGALRKYGQLRDEQRRILSEVSDDDK